MDTEKLIEEVRKYPVLYDQTSDQYKHTEYKEKIWIAIAKKLKAEGGVETCKKKWSSVRDHFRRILQKRKATPGQANHRKYKFENHLDFLLPHITERESITNVPSTKDNQEEDETYSMIDESQHGNNIEEKQREAASEHNETESIDDEAHSQCYLAGVAKNDKFAKPAAAKRKVRHPEKVRESPLAQLMDYFLSETRTENERKKRAAEELQKHPVDAFLAGIAPSLKLLSPLLLHEAKGSIFTIVQEYELKQLMVNQNLLSDRGPAAKRSAFSSAPTSSRIDPNPCLSSAENERKPTPVYQQLDNIQAQTETNSRQTDTCYQ